MKEFTIETKRENASHVLYKKLKELNTNGSAVILNIGSDCIIGDSVAPIVGSLLKERGMKSLFVYGDLSYPVTALNVENVFAFIRKTHGSTTVIAIDAAVGKSEDVGKIKLTDRGIKPGLGVMKDIVRVGDISIMAIVSERECNTMKSLNEIKMSFIYKLSESIADALCLLDGEA